MSLDTRSFRGTGFRNRGNSEVDWTNVVGVNDNSALLGPVGQMPSRLTAPPVRGPEAQRASFTSRLNAYETSMRSSVSHPQTGMSLSSAGDERLVSSSSFGNTAWRHSIQESSPSTGPTWRHSIQGGSTSSSSASRHTCSGEMINGRGAVNRCSIPEATDREEIRCQRESVLSWLTTSSAPHTPRASHMLSPRESQIGWESVFRDKVMDQVVALGFLLVSEHELVLKEHTSRLEREVALLRKAVHGTTSVSNHELPDRLPPSAELSNGDAQDGADGTSSRGGYASGGASNDPDNADEAAATAAAPASEPAAQASGTSPTGMGSISIPLDFGIINVLQPVKEESAVANSAQQNGISAPDSAIMNGEGGAPQDEDSAMPLPLSFTPHEVGADPNDVKSNKRISVQTQAMSSAMSGAQRARMSHLLTESVKKQQKNGPAFNADGENSIPGCPAIGEESIGRCSELSQDSALSHHEMNTKKVMFGDLGYERDSEKLDLSNPDIRFPMWEIWLEKSSKDSVFARASMGFRRQSEAKSGFFGDDDDSDDSTVAKDIAKIVTTKGARKTWRARKLECQRRIISHPSSKRRMFWELLGCLLVCIESVIIPTQFLELPETTFLNVMSWIARIFWTLDLPASFAVGYRRGVHTEMRPRRIVLNYLKTWFTLDFAILAADWYDVFMANSSMDTARMGRTLKTTRIIRMVRLLRLLRLQRVPDFALAKSIAFWFRSEFTHIVLGILKIMIFVIWVNHVIACLWYAHGNRGGYPNWMLAAEMDGEAFDYKYATSFHWSLTQFTGSMEVFPTNSSERFFAVVILLCAFFISASVVSAITSMMTRLEIATAQESERFTLLKQYLFDNHITSKVALRVERNAQHALAERKRNTPESSIELLGLVSEPLRVELHFEINMPVLGYHPFFRNYSLTSPSTMRQVCHQCVARLTLSRSDVLFRCGEVAVRMFFVVSGRLTYIRNEQSDMSVNVGDWACEAVIWTPWANVGTLRVKSDCTLAMIDVERFQQLALQYDMDGYAKKYGEKFLRFLNNSKVDDLTDLEDPNMDAQDLADICCPPPQSEDQTIMSRLNYHMRWLNRNSAKKSQTEDSWFKPCVSTASNLRNTGIHARKRSTVRNTEINAADLGGNFLTKSMGFASFGSGRFGNKNSRDPGKDKKNRGT